MGASAVKSPVTPVTIVLGAICRINKALARPEAVRSCPLDRRSRDWVEYERSVLAAANDIKPWETLSPIVKSFIDPFPSMFALPHLVHKLKLVKLRRPSNSIR